MIAVQLTRVFRVLGDEDFEHHADQVMEQLLCLESANVRDADVSGSATERRIEISIYAIADTFDDAADLADSTIRSAIHAAGGYTPDWEAVRTLTDRAELADA